MRRLCPQRPPGLLVPYRECAGPTPTLQERVTALGRSLLRLGLQPGTAVGIWSQNCAEWF